ncbi:MAG: argininosuccinate lyase [Acidimicrobiales bacterium]
MTLWSGRFSSGMGDVLWDLSESYSFDYVLYPFDIQGSKAHVTGLVRAGLLSAEEGSTLTGALDEVVAEFDDRRFERAASDEDIHMAIERRVIELAGDVGAKLHTARSRNDQVATTFRLFTMHAITRVAEAVLHLVDVLVGLGERNADAYLPGYTHLQRAQPVLLDHHLNAHAWSLLRDVDRLLDARDRMNVSPLGAGALAGTSLPIDPQSVADDLGFDRPFANSLDAVSDRDFVAEALFDIALLGVHLSRMGEELVLWTTTEFNFAELSDEFTTGSSMLPQKKNSDVAELARAKSGRLVGNLTGLLVMLKGLPLSYNRDLQEDKEPLFDSYRHVTLVLAALSGAYETMTFNAEVAAHAADDEFMVAIDLAEGLVGEGIPFRQAHERVGKLVGDAVAAKRSLRELVAESPDFERFLGLFEPGVALSRRRSPGAAGPVSAAAQHERLAAARTAAADRLRGGATEHPDVAGPFL